MKKYNDLEELLADFSMDLLNMAEGKTPIESKKLAKKYCKANSLALGKPEPLAKNKQFEKVCEHNFLPKQPSDATNYCVCTKCGNYIKQT